MSKVSVLIPTLNSEATLPRCIRSILEQDLPREDIEILVIDGGSSDRTLEIAKEASARVVPNPQVQPEWAKFHGIRAAQGEVLVFLDSDEAFRDRDALTRRMRVFQDFPGATQVSSSGYLRPADAPWIHDYMNRFSDPFSYFMYRTSSEEGSYVVDLKAHYPWEVSRRVYEFAKKPGLHKPLRDLSAGIAVSREALIKHLDGVSVGVELVPLLSDLLIDDSGCFHVLESSPIFHFSPDTLKKYVRKLHWRVLVNTHFVSDAGTGFSNRFAQQPARFRFKRYLFVLYALSFFGPLLDALWMQRRGWRASTLIHPFLCGVTLYFIVLEQLRKFLNLKTQLKAYGAKQ